MIEKQIPFTPDAEERCEFCEDMAQAIAEGKTLADIAEAYPHFPEWVKEQSA